MARDNPNYECSQDRHIRQPGKRQGREAGARRAERERERERTGTRRMKRSTVLETWSPRQKPAEREPSTRQKTGAARKETRTTGTRALSPLTET